MFEYDAGAYCCFSILYFCLFNIEHDLIFIRVTYKFVIRQRKITQKHDKTALSKKVVRETFYFSALFRIILYQTSPLIK